MGWQKQWVAYATGYSEVVFGGADVSWLPKEYLWNSTELINGYFAVQLRIENNDRVLQVDGVKVTITYAGEGDTDNRDFDAISIDSGGIDASFGANGQPPIATLGALFEDSLVTNEVSIPGRLRYSLPGKPDAFPALYYIDFETPENDAITAIEVVNSKLIVCTKYYKFRVNYLPVADDASFSRGRCYEVISSKHGIMDPNLSAIIAAPDGREELVGLSTEGLYATDGFTEREIGSDIALSMLMSGGWVALTANNKHSYLTLIKANGLSYDLNYHASHIKEGGRCKVTGPNDMVPQGVVDITCAAWVRLNDNTSILVAGTTSGFCNRNSGGWVVPSFFTRRLFLNGMGQEFIARKFYLYTNAVGSGTRTINLYDTKTNQIGFIPLGNNQNSAATLSLWDVDALVEGPLFQIGVVGDASTSGETQGIVMMVLEWDSLGNTDA